MKFQTGYKLGTGDLCGLILEGGGGLKKGRLTGYKYDQRNL